MELVGLLLLAAVGTWFIARAIYKDGWRPGKWVKWPKCKDHKD